MPGTGEYSDYAALVAEPEPAHRRVGYGSVADRRADALGASDGRWDIPAADALPALPPSPPSSPPTEMVRRSAREATAARRGPAQPQRPASSAAKPRRGRRTATHLPRRSKASGKKSFSIAVCVRVRPWMGRKEAEGLRQEKAAAQKAARRGARRAGSAPGDDLTGRREPSCLMEAEEWDDNVVCIGTNAAGVRKRFEYPAAVIQPHHDQVHTYTTVMDDHMDALFDGYDCTVFAYGQTGSGKTHTVMGPPGGVTEGSLRMCAGGDSSRACGAGAGAGAGSAGTRLRGGLTAVPESWGLFPRASLELLDRIHCLPAGTKATATVSAVEVYFDCCYDLLNNKNLVRIGGVGSTGRTDVAALRATSTYDKDGKWIPPHELQAPTKTPKRAFEMSGQTELPLAGPGDVARVARLVEATRVAHGHKLNHRSSRSHCIITMTLTQRHAGGTVRSRFLFVDLAGSERIYKSGVVGTRRKEAVAVNTSLTALGRCIQMLASRRRGGVVPFRDSTLTMLMRESLGGACRTAMIVTIAQEPEHAEETIGSLRFGERSAQVSTRVVRNRTQGKASVAHTKAALAQARAKLQELARKGMAGGINPAVPKCTRDQFWDNKAKLNAAEVAVQRTTQQMAELRAVGGGRKGEMEALQAAHERAKHSVWVMEGLVIRMTYAGVFIRPRRAFVQKQGEIRTLKQQLRNQGVLVKDQALEMGIDEKIGGKALCHLG